MGGFSSVSVQCSRTRTDRKSTRLNSSHANISYAVFCLKKKKKIKYKCRLQPTDRISADQRMQKPHINIQANQYQSLHLCTVCLITTSLINNHLEFYWDP